MFIGRHRPGRQSHVFERAHACALSFVKPRTNANGMPCVFIHRYFMCILCITGGVSVQYAAVSSGMAYEYLANVPFVVLSGISVVIGAIVSWWLMNLKYGIGGLGSDFLQS